MTTINPELDAVIRRVQKLLAIAQDDRANEHEAAAAAAQAEKLMRKFQIDHADLIEKEIREDQSSMATEDSRADAITNGTKAKTIPPWASLLAVGVARMCEVGVTTAYTETMGKCVRFYGYKHDVKMAQWMMQYFVATINRLAFQYRSTEDYRAHGRSVLTDYRKGVVQGILMNINKYCHEREEEMRKMSASRALIIVKKDAIVERFGDVFRTKKTQTSIRRDSSFSNGREAGRNVDIHRRGIEHSGPNSGTLRLN